MLIRFLVVTMALLGQATQTPSNAPQQPAVDPSQMSVAERAAAARKARAADASSSDIPQLTPQQHGSVRGSQYVNDFFHFRIDLANQWEPLGIERIAASRAKIRELGLSSSRGIALEMEDSLGRNVILNILPIPPDAPANAAEDLAAAAKKLIFQQLTSAKDANEQVFLGDAGHKFAGFRYAFTLQGVSLVQSKQLIFSHGFVLVFTVTGRSEPDVSDTLRKLNSRMTWTAAP
jgi:hypothetical protein